MVDWSPNRAAECQKAAELAACRPGEVWGLGYLYRFEDKQYASLNPYKYEWGNDDEYDIVTKIHLKAYLIRSITPCGWTIKAVNGLGWRFISRETTKRFALPTMEEAMESYVARKQKQAAIYQARAAKAYHCIMLAKGMSFDLVEAKKTLDRLKVSVE